MNRALIVAPIAFDQNYKNHIDTETMYQAKDDIDVLELCAKLETPEQMVALITELFRKNATESNQEAIKAFISNIWLDQENGMYGFMHQSDNFFEYWPGENINYAFCIGFFNSLYGTDPEDIAEAFDIDDYEPIFITGDGEEMMLNLSEISKMYKTSIG